MTLLLDTHIALWAIGDDPRLPERAREMILEPDNRVAVSAASIWEIAVKHDRRPEVMPLTGTRARHWFLTAGYQLVDISAQHAAAIDDLPPIHRDPFDRILVAQAATIPMHLVTRDSILTEYGAPVIRV